MQERPPVWTLLQTKELQVPFGRTRQVYKQLEIHPRLKPALEEAAVEFRKVLGRAPGPKDPIVFNQHLTGEEEFWQHARTVGRTANIPEQLIFAWRRSGFIVGKHSRRMMPENDYEEWTDAIDEYFTIKEDGFDPFFVFTYLSGKEYEEYKALVETRHYRDWIRSDRPQEIRRRGRLF